MCIQSQEVDKEHTKGMLSLCPKMCNSWQMYCLDALRPYLFIIFTVNGKDNCSKDFVVRRKKMSDALYWLTGVNKHGQPNNFLYKDVRLVSKSLKLNYQ